MFVGWWLYDDATNELIESYYRHFTNDTSSPGTAPPYVIRVGADKYLIDFTASVQVSETDSRKRR